MSSFFRACNVYKTFVRMYSIIARPLKDYLRNGKELDWLYPKTEALDVFDNLESKLMKPSVLNLLQPYKPCMINTDASAYAMGATFLQQKTTALWKSELRSVTEAEHLIRQDNIIWKPIRYDLQNYRQSSSFAHTLQWYYLKFKQSITVFNGKSIVII